MNEAETRSQLIYPALKAAGWGVVPGSRVREEVIAPGRIIGGGNADIYVTEAETVADYVLTYRDRKLAVVEAKKRGSAVTLGLAQAKDYAERLRTPFAYCTNGDELYAVDRRSGEEGPVSPAVYPGPEAMWERAFGEASLVNRWREAFGRTPLNEGGGWGPRYYQHNAVTATLDAIAGGRDRVLLTMATGTGKTAVAFQIVWKLFEARWSLANRGDPAAETGRPRVLFLADRNVLASQAINKFKAFGAFEEAALVRIDPKAIAKQGGIPTNGSVFFTIFQTFMTAAPASAPGGLQGGSEDDEAGAGLDDAAPPSFAFHGLPPDFFDLIIIDECHRGGANSESTWRGILDYFSPAVQLGLTATPKRGIGPNGNADTYAYFGEPVYTYSLRQGINDGFLTPFRVRQVQTTLDEYRYVGDDTVDAGEIDRDKTYTEAQFNRSIQIAAREKKRVELFMDALPPGEKAIVFCATEDHALRVRDLINQRKPAGVTSLDYCCRVTSQEGEVGNGHLLTFQDNEKTIPTVLTTSRKLSTGVDALGVRHIVLLRPVNSMIEFKQILGRGTRLMDGKYYFTLHDFVRAHGHFHDEQWDGEPEEVLLVEEGGTEAEAEDCDTPDDPAGGPEAEEGERTGPGGEGEPKPEMISVTLAPGKELLIDAMVSTHFYSPDGAPRSAAEFLATMFEDLPSLFGSEEELRRLWSHPNTRKALLEGLVERGYGAREIGEVMKLARAEASDIYDVLAYIAFTIPTTTRADRVGARLETILEGLDTTQQAFVRFVLNHYVEDGVDELSLEKLPHLLQLQYGGNADAAAAFADLGGVSAIHQTFVDFQPALYGDG